MANRKGNSEILEKIGSDIGQTIINKNSQLRRLNYFDGKFLRAPDLILEQQALLNQVRISNQAGGAGVVHGYDCTLGAGDNLQIGSGFAIDFLGRVLLLSDGIRVDIPELIERSRKNFVTSSAKSMAGSSLSIMDKELAADKVKKDLPKKANFDDCVIHTKSAVLDAADSNDLYLITINHTEAFCGQEDVFGKLCSEACSTSTSHSYIIEGIEVRAVPLNLSVLLKQSSAVPLSQAHLRSRVASAFYAEERNNITSHISASGLSSLIWCLGAEAVAGGGIPIAVMGRRGTSTLFLDAWTARRERMVSPPQHYWAGRMAMRPWNVFLAQILQFQCHLRGCLTSKDPGAPCKTFREFDPCADTREAAREAAKGMRYLLDTLGEAAEHLAEFEVTEIAKRAFVDFDGGVTQLEQNYQRLVDSARMVVPNRLLINCGIVEVPSAGYLPVNASSSVSVNEQVQRLLGEGLDLRFCVVRPDVVAHALEEAQHMDRICLLSGIDDPARKPKVDVLVPNGEIQQLEIATEGTGYQSKIAIHREAFSLGWPRKDFAKSAGAHMDISPSTPSHGVQVLSIINRSAENISTSLHNLGGAARGEHLETGGYEFYLAAKSGERSAVKPSAYAYAEQDPHSALELLDGQEEVLGDTNIHMLRLRSGLTINTNEATDEALDTAISTQAPESSLWLDLKTERNPFDLNSGDVTDVRARVTMVDSRNVHNRQIVVIQERTVNGQLHIQESAPQQTDTKFTARLIAQGTWTETILTGGNRENRSEPVRFDEKVTVSRTGLTGLPPTISIAITNPSFFGNLDNVQLVFERIWSSPTESRIRSLLRYQNPMHSLSRDDDARNDEIPVMEELPVVLKAIRQKQVAKETLLFEGGLKEDQAVTKPGNQFHSASLSALNQIGKATNNTSFSDQAGRLLFPPPKPVSSELRILARESWVLFHRRRDKICAAAAAEEAAVKARSYRVYHVHLEDKVAIDELAAKLETNASAIIARFDATPVTVIDYAPGLATVATTHSDVRADWQAAVQVDADVHIGLIASEGDVITDGEALADNRLQRLTDLLAPVSEAADELALLSINEVPPTLAAGEVDGVIIYFTKAVETVCHNVHRLVTNSTEAVLERLELVLRQSSEESLPGIMEKLGAQLLSTNPRFIRGSDTFFGANEAQKLAASWELVDDGPVTKVITMSAEEIDEQQFITRQQARKISQTVGTDLPIAEVIYKKGLVNHFKRCTKVSLLLAEIECNDIFVLAPPVRDVEGWLKLISSIISEQGLPAEFLKPSGATGTAVRFGATHLGAVDFYRDSSQFETDSRNQFLHRWQSNLSGTSAAELNGIYLVVARAGSNDQETAANLAHAKAQGEKLQELMGINSSGVQVVTNNSNVAFPVNCRAITLTVIPKIFRNPVGTSTSMAVALDISPAGATTGTTGTTTASPPPGDTGAAPDIPISSVRQPALTLELARSISFDENNSVIRDERFNAALAHITESGDKIKELELISVEADTDEEAEVRARALMKILKDEGAANRNASLVIREADEAETVEILHSGFLLNRGMVLRQ